MKRPAIVVLVLAALGVGGWYYQSRSGAPSAAAPAGPGGPAPGAAPGGGGARGGGRGMGRTPMTVDVSRVARRDLVDYITVVGNLIGEQTVDVTPRVAGRIESVAVKLGDRVARGQTVAKIEDREIREQINQAQATLDVNKATVVQRESDLKVLESALDRNRTSYDRGLVAKQVLEDVEARHNAAVAQVSVAKAQQASTQARIDELKITLSNTTILSPLDGFVSRRNLDVGAFAGANTVILTVVDLGTVRLVANLVEKGFRRVVPGVDADVEVDSFQGETFHGQVSRVAPAFDPATRTAPMEIEVPNPGFRLKPGMYARVRLTVERRPQSLTVPRAAVVDTEGKRGVFVVEGQTARFREVQTGLQDGDHLEILSGLDEGTPVVTLGALALKDGDRVALPGDPGQAGGSPRGGGEGAAPGARSGRGGRGGGRQGQGGDARGK